MELKELSEEMRIVLEEVEGLFTPLEPHYLSKPVINNTGMVIPLKERVDLCINEVCLRDVARIVIFRDGVCYFKLRGIPQYTTSIHISNIKTINAEKVKIWNQ